MTIHIGTSGWHYGHWRGAFYPEQLAESEWLTFYASEFSCVEVNSTFYGFPPKAVIADWLAATPDHFRFAVKASRYITHMKKLKDCAEPLRKLFLALEGFAGKTGPVLFQLPPRWQVNVNRLAAFLELLPAEAKVAMEFRDPSWHCAEVWQLLARHNVAWCEFHLPGVECHSKLTAPFSYQRLHGPGPDAYCGCYDSATLKQWAERIRERQQQGVESWVFFDNDEAGYAVRNARELLGYL